MSDLDQFLALVRKVNGLRGYDFRTHDLRFKGSTMLVEVLPGTRAHFEAEFDDAGNIVSMGQWDEM